MISMSEFTDALFNPVINSVLQLESQRNALNTQVASQSAQIASLQAELAAKPATNRDTKIAQVLIAAMYYMAFVPKIDYVFGGESVSGMDCSGFVQTVFKAASIVLPRVSADQINKGTNIPLGQEQAGDLLGFDLGDRNGSGIEHIGICIGNGLMIHTAKPGEGINIANYRKRYGSSFVKVARVF
jgi:cell wall-associated NlpC family hydrolase